MLKVIKPIILFFGILKLSIYICDQIDTTILDYLLYEGLHNIYLIPSIIELLLRLVAVLLWFFVASLITFSMFSEGENLFYILLALSLLIINDAGLTMKALGLFVMFTSPIFFAFKIVGKK